MNCNVFCKCILLYQIAKTVEKIFMRSFVFLYFFYLVQFMFVNKRSLLENSVNLLCTGSERKLFYEKLEYLPIGIILWGSIINPIFKLRDANIRSAKCRRTCVVKLHQVHLFECLITWTYIWTHFIFCLDWLQQEGTFHCTLRAHGGNINVSAAIPHESGGGAGRRGRREGG